MLKKLHKPNKADGLKLRRLLTANITTDYLSEKGLKKAKISTKVVPIKKTRALSLNNSIF